MSEAESVLTGGDALNSKVLDKVVSDFGDQASFALQLLGKICNQTERGACATEAFTKVCYHLIFYLLTLYAAYLTDKILFLGFKIESISLAIFWRPLPSR